jgi:predicted phosphate transport protein (TIGR00153 family)
MLKKFLPKDKTFFNLTSELSDKILDGAKLLHEMFVKFDNFEYYSQKINDIERQCDAIVHKIVNELNETFVTPIDREDLYELANNLDNIIDSMYVIANRIHLYKVKNPVEFGPKLSAIILKQTELLKEIVPNVTVSKESLEKIVAIKQHEIEGDMVFRDALEKLFDTEKDAIELIKKKEILEVLEKAVDRCHKAGVTIEAIIIKNV